MDSDLVVDAEQLASITAEIDYDVPAGGLTGEISSRARDTVNGNTDFLGNLGVTWHISDGGNTADFTAVSAVDVASGSVYSVSSDFNYGSNQYSLMTTETVSDFVLSADGGYGGDSYQWYVM